MIPGRDRGSNDVLVCADVLGAFGVTPSAVRRRVDGDGSLESMLADALDDARDRTELCRRLICDADRGIDCAARYGDADLESELRSLLEGLGWSATVERRGDEAFDVAVTDGASRRREVTVTYPDTPLGANNLPAVLSTLERRLLPGVDARFALLSEGEDRWRAALIETDELERIRERYGDRVSAFDRPLLSGFDPDDYVPERPSDGRDEVPDRIAGGRDEAPEPWPDWAVDGTARAAAEARSSSAAASVDPLDGSGADAATSEDGATAVGGLIEEAEPDRRDGEAEPRRRDEEADTSGTARTLGEMWTTGDGTDADPTAADSSPVESVAGESAASGSSSLETGSDPYGGTERSESNAPKSGETKPTETESASTESPEAEPAGTESAGGRADSGSNRDSASADSSAGSTPSTTKSLASTASESSDDGLTLAGGSPSVSRVCDDGVAEDSAATARAAEARESSQSGTGGGRSRDGASHGDPRADAREDDSGADGSSGSEDSSGADSSADRSSGDGSTEGEDSSADDSSGGEPAANVSTRDDRETETSGFGTLSGSTKTARVTNDAFGADVETQTEDERYQALGAAIGSGRNVSVKGLLEDDEFLPELPAVEPETTRIEFEDEFEPEAVSEAKAAAEESGFVWVDSGSIETTRVSDG